MTSKQLALGKRFLDELKRLNDDRAILLTAHLLTEHWIDKLIEKKSLTPKDIFGDQRSFTYSVKLILVYNMGLIPKPLFDNLRILNGLRNAFAHDLDFKIDSQEGLTRIARLTSGPIEPINFSEFSKGLGPCSTKDVLGWVSLATFGWLHTHCLNDVFKVRPDL